MRSLAWIVLGMLSLTTAFAAFAPPTASERAAALGDLKDESPELRRLLLEDSDFDLIPLPQRGDWLATHYERGQSFGTFQSIQKNQPDETRRTIYLLPMGAFHRGGSPSLETLRAFAAAFFQLPVKILPAYLPAALEFDPRVNPGTKKVQILTSSILKYLGTRLPADAFCLLGVTMEDLYPAPSWNYVFGQASLTERVGIYSFARYDPEFSDESRPDNYKALLLQRSCKVLAHETGHMFGLQHCIYYNCLLNGANHLAETDAQSMQLCPICLRKLQHGAGFDARRRYTELARFYRAQKLKAEADWCDRQLAKTADAK